MKQAMNFRLSNQVISILSMLEQETHSSKTAIVEKALQYYAKKKLANQNNILQYAGILGDKEADAMLALIQSNKHNKNVDFDL